jgi:streptomycin 6-kinase
VARWDLELGEPFRGGSAAWAGPVRLRGDGGREAVLKITLPHREARFEGAGLRLWDGGGTVLLLDEHQDDDALLVERCRPGTDLNGTDGAGSADERLAAAASLLRRLWARPVPDGAPFESVADVCREWADLVRTRMERLRPDLDPGLVDHGASLLESLSSTATRSVLVHGDFNPGNILRAEREPWLAIDAKPMIGDPGYDPLPLVFQVDEPADDGEHPVEVLRDRFALVADVTGEPFERLVAWAVARLVEAALWHVSLAEPTDAAAAMAQARRLADLAGL